MDILLSDTEPGHSGGSLFLTFSPQCAQADNKRRGIAVLFFSHLMNATKTPA